MSGNAVFIVAFGDNEYDAVIPAADAVPRLFYGSLEEALRAVDAWSKSFDVFRPALYGQAYPYEHTTLAQEVSKTGRGVYGWAEFKDEDGDVMRYALCVVALRRAV